MKPAPNNDMWLELTPSHVVAEYHIGQTVTVRHPPPVGGWTTAKVVRVYPRTGKLLLHPVKHTDQRSQPPKPSAVHNNE